MIRKCEKALFCHTDSDVARESRDCGHVISRIRLYLYREVEGLLTRKYIQGGGVLSLCSANTYDD